jgi:hypothetical protein
MATQIPRKERTVSGEKLSERELYWLKRGVEGDFTGRLLDRLLARLDALELIAEIGAVLCKEQPSIMALIDMRGMLADALRNTGHLPDTATGGERG